MINAEVKLLFRQNMNGVASARMRESGFDYRIIFGIELPRMEAIAAEVRERLCQGCGEGEMLRLAMQLWGEGVRESKILALMLVPLNAFTEDMAEVWAEGVTNVELARLFAMYVLVREPYAVSLAFHWIASEQAWRQLCGLLTLKRLLMSGLELQERAREELRDQARALLRSPNRYVADMAQKTKDEC